MIFCGLRGRCEKDAFIRKHEFRPINTKSSGYRKDVSRSERDIPLVLGCTVVFFA